MLFRRALVVAATSLILAGEATGQDIARCTDARGAVTYQPAPCPASTEESRPQIPVSFPEPNRAESQRIFEREAALDRRLEARRDRELQEQQMREARAEREAERERLALLAAAQQQPYYYSAYPAYPAWPVYNVRRAPLALPRHSGQPISR